MIMHTRLILGALLFSVSYASLRADTTHALCEIYAKGKDQMEKSIACDFSQRQGFINIVRSDGISHDLSPDENAVGTFHDQHGSLVYRESGLGEQGLIFRFPAESIYVYWDTSALDSPAEEDNWTAPFTTQDYDATTRLNCKAAGDSEFGSCPAGISRMENNQASITIQDQMGKQFTLNFMTGYVNSTGGEVKAHREGDTWVVETAEGAVYEIPVAAIEGG
jgi:hypothetical protein